MELGQGLFLGNEPVQLIQNNNFVSTNPFYFDDNAYAFLQAAQITDQTTVFAINNLVIDLKDAGLWTKLQAIYPFVGGTALTHKWNLKDVNNYNLTFYGTITHNSNGIAGNGTDGYYDTGLTTANISQDSNAYMIYIRTNVQEDKSDFGYFTADRGWQTTSRTGGNNHLTRNYSTNAQANNVSNSNSIGLFSNTRTASGSYTKGINKTHTTVTSTSNAYNPSPAIPILGMCLATGATTRGFYSTRNYAMTAIGNSGFTTTEVNNFVDINQTFQTALGRFV